MSTLASAQTNPAAAVAHAERRLRLLEVMMRFGMGLTRALQRRAERHPGLIVTKVLDAIETVLRLVKSVEGQTVRQLSALRFGKRSKTGPPPPPPARGARVDRDVRQTADTESRRAFLAGLKAVEALLDQEGEAADWSAFETVQRLCRVMNLDPALSHCLGDDWIEENLTLRRAFLTGDAPFFAAARMSETGYGFKEILRQRVREAIAAYVECEEEFAELFGNLEKRLARDEPYMRGSIPLRDAVFKLCAALDMHPNPDAWHGGGWIVHNPRCERPTPPRALE